MLLPTNPLSKELTYKERHQVLEKLASSATSPMAIWYPKMLSSNEPLFTLLHTHTHANVWNETVNDPYVLRVFYTRSDFSFGFQCVCHPFSASTARQTRGLPDSRTGTHKWGAFVCSCVRKRVCWPRCDWLNQGKSCGMMRRCDWYAHPHTTMEHLYDTSHV